MKEQSLMVSTLILTATSFFTRTIGMISIIFLSHILGAEGVGIYELTMSVYTTAVAFASAGLCVSVSKLVAEELGRSAFVNIAKIMRIAFTFALTLSFLIGLLLFISAPFLATSIIHDSHAAIGLRLLSISIPFISCSSCFKGYFYATKKTVFPASADILEQIVKLGLILTLVRIYLPLGQSYTYAAIGLGLTIGEMTSWSYLGALFILDRRNYDKSHKKDKVSHSDTLRHLFIRLINMLLPIASISYIAYVFMSLENILIPSGLKKFGNSLQESLGLYGMLKGMVLPILFFPAAFLRAFSTTLVPEIARSNVLGRRERVVTTTNRVLQLTFILSILVVGIFFTYSNELGFAIYKSDAIGPMLRTLAIIVPFIYTEVVCDGILKGLGKQMSCLKFSMLDSICRIILIYFLLPIKGMTAFMGIMIISCILTSTLNFNALMRATTIKFQFSNWLLKPAVAAAAGGSFSRLIINQFFRYQFGLTTKVILGIGLSAMIYLIILFILECLSSEDVAWLKKHIPFLN